MLSVHFHHPQVSRHGDSQVECVMNFRTGGSVRSVGHLRSSGGGLVGGGCLEGIVEIEPEKLRILADHGRRDDIEHVVIGLLWDPLAVALQQLPEIPVPGVLGKSSHQASTSKPDAWASVL